MAESLNMNESFLEIVDKNKESKRIFEPRKTDCYKCFKNNL